ncbi:MAG: uracil-DNA glycosylase [Rickettsiales bacterium]|nr:uracil-DNA glycosylase [Rickettsiales bacterium]
MKEGDRVLEDLVILLEWLNANGINEVFADAVVNEEEGKKITSYIIEPTENKSLDRVLGSIAKQQNILRQNDTLYADIEKIRNLVDKTNSIDNLIKTILETEYYTEKRKLANNTLVFKGKLDSKVLVINDLPSESDDINNDIFYGEAGELLKRMFKAINVDEDSLSMMNSFFWRLAGGRSPIKEELYMCKPFVEKIISIIRPQMIIFTGNYSVSVFLEENQTVAKTRGKIFDYTNVYLDGSIKATSLYNPNFILEKQGQRERAEAWHDLQIIARYI